MWVCWFWRQAINGQRMLWPCSPQERSLETTPWSCTHKHETHRWLEITELSWESSQEKGPLPTTRPHEGNGSRALLEGMRITARHQIWLILHQWLIVLLLYIMGNESVSFITNIKKKALMDNCKYCLKQKKKLANSTIYVHSHLKLGEYVIW